MDELTLLRNTRSEIEPPPAALHRGRAALLERAAGGAAASARPARSRRRRWAIGSVVSVGAAALATGLVLTDVVGLAGWRGGADAAAAAALEQASAAAITAVDPVLEPGQYLEVRTRAVHGSFNMTTGFLRLADDTLYRPADPVDDWVWARGPQAVYETFGPESEEFANEWLREKEEEDTFENGDLLRAAGGAFYGGESAVSAENLEALPRDPYRLLNHIYRVTLGMGPGPDTEALVFMADLLRSGVVPADLRGAMYEAAAMIPGVTFTEGQATLDGRTGIAIGRDEESWGERMEIIIDPATGEFIGERSVALRDHDDIGIAAGGILSWSAVTLAVVDAAPEGGSPHGKMRSDRTIEVPQR